MRVLGETCLDGDATTECRGSDLVTKRKPRRPQKPISEDYAKGNGPEGMFSVSTSNQNQNEESTAKRIKTHPDNRFSQEAMSAVLDTPQRSRAVDKEETADCSGEFVIENTTLLSTETTQRMSTFAKLAPTDTASMTSESNTETSSVAHLRNWLDDFGQKQKKHYEQASSVGLVSLDALKVKKMCIPKAKSDVPHSQVPSKAAISLQRKLDSSAPRARSTPVRIKSRHSNVEATNEGYKSVAKLAAWLADDPTKSKTEIKTLRRGANVIAKSRTFDKGLADVIIEQHSIRSGAVRREKNRYETRAELEAESEAEADDQSFALETNSSVSVSDKKEWLASAFKKPDPSVDQAKTELITEQEKRDDVSARAKQMWRNRSACPSSEAKQMWRERSGAEQRLPPKTPIQRRTCVDPVTSSSRRGNDPIKSAGKQTYDHRRERSIICSESREKENNADPSNERDTQADNSKYEQDESKEEGLGFSEARKLLVQRSKQNGHNAYVLTKVGLKKAKFERIEQENRRRNSSHGKLKTKWAEPSPVEGRPSDCYVRSFVANPVSKKSFEELP